MATNKRIGLCNTHRVSLLHRRGRETQFDDLDIFFGTADDGILFCPNEQYLQGTCEDQNWIRNQLDNCPTFKNMHLIGHN